MGLSGALSVRRLGLGAISARERTRRLRFTFSPRASRLALRKGGERSALGCSGLAALRWGGATAMPCFVRDPFAR